MSNLTTILAKSEDKGGTTLLAHTQQVAAAIRVFATKYQFDFDEKLAEKAAALHDLGKAHHHFQNKIKGISAQTLKEKNEQDIIHRHELSSLGFLPIFPKEEWDAIIDMVVAHHKAIKDDKRKRGILDLENEMDKHWKRNHLCDWEDWSPYGLEILSTFGYAVRPISKQEAQAALDYTVEYCEEKRWGWSPLRGLLMSADHFASAFIEATEEKIAELFEVPDLGFYHDPNRKSELYALSLIDTEDVRPHTMVVAPTGAGKTDFLLRRCRGRVFYTLPFQASINAMYERIKSAVPNNKGVRVLHATSALLVKNNREEQTLQSFAGASVKVLTPHQMAAIIFGTSGYEGIMLDLQGTDVILDEIHTYTDVTRSMVLEIVRTLLRLNCRIHIGTATMPSLLYHEVLKLLKAQGDVYEVKLEDTVLDGFDRHVTYKMETEEEIDVVLDEAFQQDEKVLVIFNTVKKAQAEYKRLISKFPDIPAMLIHSRFRRGDRVKLEERLKEEFNGSERSGPGFKPCFVISTQVVEVSLDISFDRMITQAAPLDALIQRFGRVNRKRSVTTIGKYKPVHVIKPTGSALPYKMETLKASFDQLEDGKLLKERYLQEKIDVVYPTLDTRAIDVHLIYHNGHYLIKELCNKPQSVLIEALEIESATCILECDREKYLYGNWEKRIHLEIPVNFKTIAKFKDQYEQLEVGAYPFVVRQPESEHLLYGLELTESENFM